MTCDWPLFRPLGGFKIFLHVAFNLSHGVSIFGYGVTPICWGIKSFFNLSSISGPIAPQNISGVYRKMCINILDFVKKLFLDQ